MAKQNTIAIATDWFITAVMNPTSVSELTKKELTTAINREIDTNGISIVTLEQPYNMRPMLLKNNCPGIVMIVTKENVQGKKGTEQMQYIKKV